VSHWIAWFVLISSVDDINACICSRAVCYLQTLKLQFAVADFKKVLSLETNNETVRQQMLSTQKLIRKIEFEKVRGLLVVDVRPQ